MDDHDGNGHDNDDDVTLAYDINGLMFKKHK